MSKSIYRHIVGENGFQGQVQGVTHDPDNLMLYMLVQLDNGQHVLVPVADVSLQEDGNYYVPLAPDDFDTDMEGSPVQQTDYEPTHEARQDTNQESMVLPLVAEEAHVRKQRVKTGKVRVTKHVRQWEEQIDEPLLQQHVNVTRVPLNKPIAEPPTMRREGATTIVPVIEEVLVVEKRLMLKEEIHITTQQTEEVRTHSVTLRSEEVEIEHVPEARNEE